MTHGKEAPFPGGEHMPVRADMSHAKINVIRPLHYPRPDEQPQNESMVTLTRMRAMVRAALEHVTDPTATVLNPKKLGITVLSHDIFRRLAENSSLIRNADPLQLTEVINNHLPASALQPVTLKTAGTVVGGPPGEHGRHFLAIQLEESSVPLESKQILAFLNRLAGTYINDRPHTTQLSVIRFGDGYPPLEAQASLERLLPPTLTFDPVIAPPPLDPSANK